MVTFLLFCIAVFLYVIVKQLDGLSKKNEEDFDVDEESPFEKKGSFKKRFLDGVQAFKNDFREMK